MSALIAHTGLTFLLYSNLFWLVISTSPSSYSCHFLFLYYPPSHVNSNLTMSILIPKHFSNSSQPFQLCCHWLRVSTSLSEFLTGLLSSHLIVSKSILHIAAKQDILTNCAVTSQSPSLTPRGCPASPASSLTLCVP